MSSDGSDMAAAAGLLALGAGLGVAMAVLGFIAGRFTSDSSRELAGSRRRRERDDSPDDDVLVDFSSEPRGRGKSVASLSSQSMEISAGIGGVGFSMEQARSMADANQALAMKRAPAEVLAELQRGNVRFWTGQATRPEKSAFERRALISKQFPHTAILSCSDSRVPIEIVFDQALGDMFVIRVAGNCLDTSTTASLQYAVHHLKIKVLIVMGHEGCGAVKAAQLPLDAINQEPESLSTLLKSMRRGLDEVNIAGVRDGKAQDREAVTSNVKVQVETLTRDMGVMAKVRSGELIMLGAFYELSSGIVDFFHEVSGKEEEPPSTQRVPSIGVTTRCPPEKQSKYEK